MAIGLEFLCLLCFRHTGLDIVRDFLELLSHCYSCFIRAEDLPVVLFTSPAFIFLDRVYILFMLQEERAYSCRDGDLPFDHDLSGRCPACSVSLGPINICRQIGFYNGIHSFCQAVGLQMVSSQRPLCKEPG
jgi:hypothetical protein